MVFFIGDGFYIISAYKKFPFGKEEVFQPSKDVWLWWQRYVATTYPVSKHLTCTHNPWKPAHEFEQPPRGQSLPTLCFSLRGCMKTSQCWSCTRWPTQSSVWRGWWVASFALLDINLHFFQFLSHTTIGRWKQGFPFAQPYLSNVPAD